MRRTARAALRTSPALLIGLLMTVAGSAQAQQPTPLPFDNTLSIYAAHNGTWIDWNTQLDEDAEIEDLVAAFQPAEQITDEPAVWAQHQINTPQIPAGWHFFSAGEGVPMQLHVIVRDTQNRLGSLVVTERDTAQQAGTLTANGQGSEIAGTVAVDPTCEALDIEVKNPGGATLFRAGANNPRIEDAIVYSLAYGFPPNRGDEHQSPPCPANIGPPWGDPDLTGGKVSTAGSSQNSGACAGPKAFENDSPNTATVTPKYDLLDKKLLRDVGHPNGNLAPAAMQKVVDAINAARQPYEGGVPFLAPYIAPPYSKGTAHWPMTVIGEIRALLYFPYRGRNVRRAQIAASLQNVVNANYGAGVAVEGPSTAVVAAITLTWGAPEKILYQCDPPAAVGDVWGRRASTVTPPSAMPLENIKAEVTVNLKGDIVAPGGGEGPLSGTGQATKLEAFTNPAPPTPMPAQLSLNFTTPTPGTCVVELGKGWKWKIEATPAATFYTPPAPADNLLIDGARTVDLMAHLAVTVTFKVYTVNGQGQPTGATVRVERQMNGQWQLATTGQSQQQGGQGPYFFQMGSLPKDAYYRAAALHPMTQQPGTWQYYTSVPCLEAAVTCTVPQGMGGP